MMAWLCVWQKYGVAPCIPRIRYERLLSFTMRGSLMQRNRTKYLKKLGSPKSFIVLTCSFMHLVSTNLHHPAWAAVSGPALPAWLHTTRELSWQQQRPTSWADAMGTYRWWPRQHSTWKSEDGGEERIRFNCLSLSSMKRDSNFAILKRNPPNSLREETWTPFLYSIMWNVHMILALAIDLIIHNLTNINIYT